MIISNVTKDDIQLAINSVQKTYSDNAIITELDALNAKRTRWHVQLGVLNSNGKGARRGFSGRRIKKACWHIHGHFFAYLLARGAVIRCGALVMRCPADNWQDRNIGSVVNPLLFSAACNCAEF